MPGSPEWHRKATDFFSTSGVKIKHAGQSAGGNVADVAGKVSSMMKSRWSILQESRRNRAAKENTNEHKMQERISLAAASTRVLLTKSLTETKEKVTVGKIKVGEAAKRTADKSKTILSNIERWQKGVATNDVFCVPIEVTVKRECSGKAVPQILVKCADYLVISGLRCQNLFKRDGDRKVVQHLISIFNQSCNASLPEGVSHVDVATLIKCYLASLPESIVTFGLYHEIRNARASIVDLRNILKKLPNVNFMTLEYITAMLKRVSQNSALNKMDSRSLAVELAPLIMWQKGYAGIDILNYYRFFCKAPPKIVDATTNTSAWDLLEEGDGDPDASTQIPLDDASTPDYGVIEVIQCLIEHHNAIFTDANETVWR